MSWIPLVGGVGSFGSLVLFFAIPIMFLYWWVKFAKIETPDPDYKKAKSSTWVSLALWGAVVVIGLLISVLLVALRSAATQA